VATSTRPTLPCGTSPLHFTRRPNGWVLPARASLDHWRQVGRTSTDDITTPTRHAMVDTYSGSVQRETNLATN
jgi:hypothetical protein